MARPDAISRLATVVPAVLVPLLLGWRVAALIVGVALLAGIISALIARDDESEIILDPRQPPPDL